MKQYELMVILKPQQISDDNKKPLKAVEKLITGQKGKIVATDDWGEKNMAYAMQGHERGYYVVYQIEIETEKVQPLRQKLMLQKDLLRYLLTEKES